MADAKSKKRTEQQQQQSEQLHKVKTISKDSEIISRDNN